MRMQRGTRGTVRTSPWRSNEASPTLTMMVDEQLPPARTVTGGAGGRGIAGFSRPFGLALRELGGFVLKWAGPDRWAGPHRRGGAAFSKKSSNPPSRDGVRPLAFFRVAIVQGSS